MKKKILYLSLLAMIGVASSCARKANCPAYGNTLVKPIIKAF